MEIYNKARELAEMLLETEEGKAMADAKYIFDGNQEAKKMLFDYSQYRDSVQVRMESGALSQDEFQKETEKMNEMIKNLREDPIIGEMIRTENEFNKLVNQVMNVFKATIMGNNEDGGCSGSCGSCSGCH